MDKLLSEINAQHSSQGLYTKSGGVSIVDASVIEAKQYWSNKDKNGESTQDPEAQWNVKVDSDGQRKSTYGFKAHVSVDEDGLIKSTDYIPGNVHDSNCFTSLLDGDESAAYAESAYASEKHAKWLKAHKVESRIIRRAYRNKPLTTKDKQFNRLHSGTHFTVERVFGVLKLRYDMAKARYMGLSRNRTRFELMCVAHNIKRGLSIRQYSCA